MIEAWFILYFYATNPAFQAHVNGGQSAVQTTMNSYPSRELCENSIVLDIETAIRSHYVLKKETLGAVCVKGFILPVNK